jgi:hypothetical protein
VLEPPLLSSRTATRGLPAAWSSTPNSGFGGGGSCPHADGVGTSTEPNAKVSLPRHDAVFTAKVDISD